MKCETKVTSNSTGTNANIAQKCSHNALYTSTGLNDARQSVATVLHTCVCTMLKSILRNNYAKFDRNIPYGLRFMSIYTNLPLPA